MPYGIQRYNQRMKCGWLAFAGMLQAFAQSNPPAVDFVTYLPAASANQIAVDPAGYAYVSGIYYDSRFPCTWTLGPQSPGTPLSFVTKLQPHGDGVVWTACVPGVSAGNGFGWGRIDLPRSQREWVFNCN